MRGTAPIAALLMLSAMMAATLSPSALLASTQAASTQPAGTMPATAPDRDDPAIPFDSLDIKVQNQIRELLHSPDWPLRVFALLRLERYRGEAVGAFITDALTDHAWQVRCFALREAVRQGVAIPVAALEEEKDPRVVRTALRAGVRLPQDRIAKLASALLHTRGIDELLLGIEIAAASDSEPLRTEAAKRLLTMLRNMDETVSLLASRRLAAALRILPAPDSPAAWADWLRTQPEPLALPAPAAATLDIRSPLPLVAQLDDELFTRLLDYLGGLGQRDLDLVIVMDCTASMTPMINQARAGVDSLILFLDDLSRQMRIAIIGYRDHDNQPVCDGQPFTSDIKAVRDYLFRLRITGGRDYPEAVLDGLDAVRELKWNKKATREIVLVGDAPPHPEDVYKVRALMESYRDSGITTHSVHVPMKYPAGHVESMPPEQGEQALAWLEEYNRSTGALFADIAATGGGKSATLTEGDRLVLSIMHFTIEEGWWEVFDEFYDQYLQLCR